MSDSRTVFRDLYLSAKKDLTESVISYNLSLFSFINLYSATDRSKPSICV